MSPTDRVLGLHAVQEGGREPMDLEDTRHPRAVGLELAVRKVVQLQVTMEPEAEVPDPCEALGGDILLLLLLHPSPPPYQPG